MTAEVAILNKSAVALAADSAATVRSVPQDDDPFRPVISKIYMNANKLFELVRGASVGAMFYDSADLLQVPWETIVKVYRSNRGGYRTALLQDYGEDFCQYIRDNLDRLIPVAAQERHVQLISQAFTVQVLNACHRSLLDIASNQNVRITNAVKRATLETTLSQVEAVWSTEDVKSWAEGLDGSDLVKRYGALALEVVPTHLDGWQLNATHRRKLRDLALESILRLRVSPVRTGLVFAGFGEDEIFPAITRMDIGGVVAGRLVVTSHETDRITIDEPALIMPFAQTNEAATFLMGIDPEVQDAVQEFWKEWLRGLAGATQQLVAREFPDAPEDQVARVSARMNEFGSQTWAAFANYMNNLHQNNRYGPMESSAAFLGRAELASLAENLVDLASLRNRVAIDREETVGGAIDVAVVSKGDGFIWVKRKHYFESELNPTWAGRQIHSAVSSAVRSEGS